MSLNVFNRNCTDYLSHVALITATPTEESGVKRLYDNWEQVAYSSDTQEYLTASFMKDGKKHKVVTARADTTGMTAAAVLTVKLIEYFRPKYLIMVGIAAGIALPNTVEQMYGDVIVADVIGSYAEGKFVSPSDSSIHIGNIGFIPRPKYLHIDPEVKKAVCMAIESPENEYAVHIGTMACGSSVIANTIILDQQVRPIMKNAVGLDMESYAVAYAAKTVSEPRPHAIIIKSVCDFADTSKDDKYQKFAAYTSAQFSRFLYENFLF